MSGHINAGAITERRGMAMIQKLGNTSYNHGDEYAERIHT
jgi:hypothetical protein